MMGEIIILINDKKIMMMMKKSLLIYRLFKIRKHFAERLEVHLRNCEASFLAVKFFK